MSASCLGFYLLDFFCLILEIDSFPASGLYHYSVLKYPLTDDPMAACGDRKERARERLHTCMFSSSPSQVVEKHTGYRMLPSQVSVWVSQLSFRSDSNYPQSEASVLFISISLFLYQCTDSSLRMCYEIISYLTQRARNHKKKYIHTPTQTLRNASSISKVFKDAVLCLFFFFGSLKPACEHGALHACTCVEVL